MNAAFRQLLESKLDDPDEVVRAHARARLDAYPSLATQAKNLVGSLVDWASSGFAMASDEVQAERLAICEACPLWDSTQGRCTSCGCYTRAKVSLASSQCPENRW